MSGRLGRTSAMTLVHVAVTSLVWAQSPVTQPEANDPAAVQRLVVDTGGASVRINSATGTARFVRVATVPQSRARGAAATSATIEQASAAFLRQYAGVFGVSSADTELRLIGLNGDPQGGRHVTYRQYHRGVPVFAGILSTHFDPRGALIAVNGSAIPDIALDASPVHSARAAASLAVAKVQEDLSDGSVSAVGARLVVFRAGLAKGVRGPNHLAWQVEVGNRRNVREFVFIDAHTGKLIDQITGTPDALFRRAYDGLGLPTVPPSYPASPFWTEGDAFPTGVLEADNIINYSADTYEFFSNAFGRDSFDGQGAIMDAIFNRGYGCPNASWNGTFISFCPGFTTDDVTAHEWGHAYTQYTHDLIYQWQPGALNEAYSDIWGETIDRLNGAGTDTPDAARGTGTCSAFSPPQAQLSINAPPAIAGIFPAQPAQFGPPVSTTGVTGDVALAAPVQACTALTNAAAVAGKIVLVDRGTCAFTIKVKNAQDAGAIAVLVANNVPSGLPGMGGVDPTIVIPSLGITQAEGNSIKAQLPAPGVNVTLKSSGGVTDNSLRWLIGEDVGFGSTPTGAFRDMWNPTCYSNPGKVSDTAYYVCSTADNGGVHTNSGIPNHAYALVTDGGTYNGHTIAGLGAIKAAHIYFRAMTVYQTPVSDFADHADALEQSCSDLVGVDLRDPVTGLLTGSSIDPSDCTEVSEAMAAVEMRTPPAFCAFQPILGKTPPPRCPADTTQVTLLFDDFEKDPSSRWTVSHLAVTPADFTPRDWQWTSEIPSGGTGSAFFAPDPNIGTCAPGGDESGVLQLTSPLVKLPSGVETPLLTFKHWVATEFGFDGGNLRVSVNGGAWQLVAPADFTYNPYNVTLATAAMGNTNPLAGQPAYSGTDGGSVGGSWGTTHVNLSAYAGPGDTVRLRWDFGTDGCGGVFGWFVDDVTVYACPSNAPPTLTINDAEVRERNGSFTKATFTVSMSHASARTVSVRARTENGTARAWLDYAPILPIFGLDTITIPPLSTSGTIDVWVWGDFKPEPSETFFVELFRPRNATIGDGEGVGTIIDHAAIAPTAISSSRQPN